MFLLPPPCKAEPLFIIKAYMSYPLLSFKIIRHPSIKVFIYFITRLFIHTYVCVVERNPCFEL